MVGPKTENDKSMHQWANFASNFHFLIRRGAEETEDEMGRLGQRGEGRGRAPGNDADGMGIRGEEEDGRGRRPRKEGRGEGKNGEGGWENLAK
jgi:hypothetical protein